MNTGETIYWALPDVGAKVEEAEKLILKLFDDYTIEDRSFGKWMYKDIHIKVDRLEPRDMEAFVYLVNVVDLFDIAESPDGKVELGLSIIAGERVENETV